MIRGMLFGMFVWFVVSIGILIFSHLSTSEKVSFIKAGLYGLVTAVISTGIITGIVILF